MYIVKDGFQRCLLVHFAERPRLTVDELVDLTLTKRAPKHTRRVWRTEVELACELLVLREYLRPDPSSKEKAYLAAAHVCRPGVKFPVAPRRMNRLAAPLAAAMLLNACATTSMGGGSGNAASRGAPSYWGDDQAHPAPVVRVATPNSPPQATTRAWITAQIEQYPQDSGNAVYRMCYDDCPTATPKRPARIPIVVASAATVPEHAPAIPVAAILPPTKTAATVKDGTSSVINVNEVMQKSLAEALANTFNAKPADAGSAKPKSHDARTVAAIPDESFAPPVKAKKTKPAVKKPVVESVDTEAAPVVTPVTAAVSAPAAAAPESPAAVPVAAAPAVAVAPAAVEPAKPAVAVKRKYVDRKLDPNEGASPEERAKIDRLMEEARATTPAAKNPAPATPPAAVPGPGVGVTADPGMRTVLTPSRTEVPRAVAPVQLASADPGPLRTAAGAIADTDPRDTLKAWADAWSSRDVARYFRLYAKDFVAYDPQNKAEFIARRSSVMSLANSIELKVEPVSVSIRGNHATIRFWQNYTSPRFSSRVMKALELTNEGDGWKIRRERLVNFVPANAANA